MFWIQGVENMTGWRSVTYMVLVQFKMIMGLRTAFEVDNFIGQLSACQLLKKHPVTCR